MKEEKKLIQHTKCLQEDLEKEGLTNDIVKLNLVQPVSTSMHTGKHLVLPPNSLKAAQLLLYCVSNLRL
jgi:hypothetical protein